MKSIKRALLVVSFFLPMTTQACVASPDGPLVAVEVETMENALDSCIACGCRVKGALEPGKKNEWWFSFGVVKSDARKAWEVAAPTGYCGTGAFRETASDFRQTIGTAYIVLDLSITAAVLPGGDGNLKTQLEIQKLSEFDKNGNPVYARSMQKRMLSFAGEGDITVPLLIADQHEKESFGIHEVLLRLHATHVEREHAASYGTISVSADVPGAEVLLDGGFVGRIAEGSPMLLKNVLTGTREVRVRDFSGREARQQVVVEKDRMTELLLKVLDMTPARNLNGLVPIGKNPQGYEEYLRVKDSAMVVKIPAGNFLMGSAEGEGKPDERPQHQAYVSAFLIDKTEVTWRQFRKFTKATETPLPPAPIWGTPDDYPVSFILWEEAKGYCEWVGGRLPTEAEWEKAARGTDGRKYLWGDEWDPDRCNSISGGPHRPESAGSFPDCVSPYGVLDMSGSMWEWCADWYGESYYSESLLRNPKGPISGSLRVIRGGGWMSQPLWLRTAYRFRVPTSTRKADHSFRCVQGTQE
jgi:formylglycine-generating enzyme required for sulfatase activity